MVRLSLEGEFKRVDPSRTRIIVVDGGRRLLAGYSPQISDQVKARLESQRVEVHLGEGVDAIDASGVTVAGKRIGTRTIIWTAGVRASTLAKFLGAATDKAGRVQVNPDLTIRDRPRADGGGRHRHTQSGREASARCGTGGDAARALCWQIDPQSGFRKEDARAFSIPRQRKFGGGRPKLCSFRERPAASNRFRRLDHLGNSASALSGQN